MMNLKFIIFTLFIFFLIRNSTFSIDYNRSNNFLGGGYSLLASDGSRSSIILAFGSRKFCDYWTFLQLTYGNYYRTFPNEILLKDNLQLSGKIRRFFVEPSTLPLYLECYPSIGVLNLKGKLLTPSIGGGFGFGIVTSPNFDPFKLYRANTCPWFLDFYLNFEWPNFVYSPDFDTYYQTVFGIRLNFQI